MYYLHVWLGPGVASEFCDWLRNSTLLVFILGPVDISDGHGLIHGVEEWLLLKSHWSNNFQSSSGVGPPETSVINICDMMLMNSLNKKKKKKNDITLSRRKRRF